MQIICKTLLISKLLLFSTILLFVNRLKTIFIHSKTDFFKQPEEKTELLNFKSNFKIFCKESVDRIEISVLYVCFAHKKLKKISTNLRFEINITNVKVQVKCKSTGRVHFSTYYYKMFILNIVKPIQPIDKRKWVVLSIG